MDRARARWRDLRLPSSLHLNTNLAHHTTMAKYRTPPDTISLIIGILLQMYQNLFEDDALQIALRESFDLFHSSQEEQDLALAIQLSLVSEKGEQTGCVDNGIPFF